MSANVNIEQTLQNLGEIKSKLDSVQMGAKKVLQSSDVIREKAAKMFEALYEAGVNIQMINTSEIRVSVLIAEEDVNRAVKAVHAKFFDED